MELKKAVHLLYVPTKYCNMSCKYCYLGDLTENKPEPDKILHTLDTALARLLETGYLPFNLSFHGGEVTTLSSELLDQLFHDSWSLLWALWRADREPKDFGLIRCISRQIFFISRDIGMFLSNIRSPSAAVWIFPAPAWGVSPR